MNYHSSFTRINDEIKCNNAYCVQRTEYSTLLLKGVPHLRMKVSELKTCALEVHEEKEEKRATIFAGVHILYRVKVFSLRTNEGLKCHHT